VGKVLSFPEGGLVVYGSFIGGMAAFVWFVRRHRLPALAMADIVVPSFMIGLALGRVGCLLNGCCYGGVSDVPWAITFPKYSAADRHSPPYESQSRLGDMYGFHLAADELDRARIARVDDGSTAADAGLMSGQIVTAIGGNATDDLQTAEQEVWTAFWSGQELAVTTDRGTHQIPAVNVPPRSRPVHPTQVYSAINAALICWLLWEYYPYRRRDGEVLALMLTVYPISRFLLEIIRTDESAIFGTGLSISQNISIVILLAALCGWVYLRMSPPRLALPELDASLVR
jgi:phosphatidylglycerol:prolipoprotein diacylglycerol transferase